MRSDVSKNTEILHHKESDNKGRNREASMGWTCACRPSQDKSKERARQKGSQYTAGKDV